MKWRVPRGWGQRSGVLAWVCLVLGKMLGTRAGTFWKMKRTMLRCKILRYVERYVSRFIEYKLLIYMDMWRKR